MKYCVRYSRNFEYKEEISEFKLIYKPNDKKLIDFINFYSDKRLIISLTEDDIRDIILSNKLKEQYASIESKNFAFLLSLLK